MHLFHSSVSWWFAAQGYPNPWHTTGIESEKAAAARSQRVHGWLRGLAAALPYDDLIVFVSHGASLASLLRDVLGRGDPQFSFGGFDNTSASGFILGRDVHDPLTTELLGPNTGTFAPPEAKNRGVAQTRSNAPAQGRRVPFMAFERWPMWHSQTMQSDDKPISVYSLHPTFHSLHLIVIEPQMWGSTDAVICACSWA